MMTLPDGSVLEHDHAPYDPVKAHAYYLRTRHLHPRKTGERFIVKTGHKTTTTLTAAQLAEQKAYAQHRVDHINDRLHALKAELRKKLEAAQKTADDAKKPKTATDKRKLAESAKKYRQKHKQELANKRKETASKKTGGSSTKSSTSSTKTGSVDDLKAEISKVKQNLVVAVMKQRELFAAKKSG